ncbi:hypothetical protein G6L28_14865 [Agrobacterium larrymoorei]|uniref:DUF6492 family protein n=1 Tax=Agrobacterium larrymoorei TaxID=160699 RepID=UPI001572580F|nr:DUF6492 family protein [Agrobacterium larrymoorei]NTJ43880.1 hypothetical protein [Agrobacterium larrymoorei]
MNASPIDAFMCVHSRDVEYLLEASLRSYEQHFPDKGQLNIITNDPSALRGFLDARGLVPNAIVTGDGEWLSAREMELPGWFRQQIIKLRAFRFCQSEQFCNLGADTLLLRPIARSDLIDQGKPVLYYSSHRFSDRHYRFERQRVKNVARILEIEPDRALHYVDFINDFFCFERDYLIALEEFMVLKYGSEPYVRLLKGLSASSDQTRFGEWTLYSVFVLDAMNMQPTVRDARGDYLVQIHSRLGLALSRLDSKIVHLVQKSFNPDVIRQKLGRVNPGAAALVGSTAWAETGAHAR